MADRQHTIVGFFVLMGFVILGGLIMAFGGGRSLFVRTYDIDVVFPGGVQSVQEGQTVTLAGKRIGQTASLRFVDENNLEKGVVVVVSVEGFDLPAACEMIVTPNIMGLGKPPIGLVVTDPTDARRLPQDGTGSISGRMLPMLDQVIPVAMQQTLQSAALHIGELAAALRPAAENLTRLLEARAMSEVDAKSVTANLDTLIQRFDVALTSLNALIGDEASQQNVKELIANARKMSESGVVTMENARAFTDDGKQLVKDLGVLFQKLAGATDDLSTVLRRLDQTLALAQQKTGTVGRLMTDDRLYEEMLLTARRLTKMLDDMREVLDLMKQGKLRIRAF